MPDETDASQLYIVPKQKRVQISAEDFIEPGTQGMLFPAPKRGLILFILFPDVNEQEFRDALKSAMPSYVIELRTSPRFDIGGLTRHDAFQAFKLHNINYFDLTSATMGEGGVEAALYRLRDFLREARVKFDKPLVFLVDRLESDESLAPRVMQTLTEYSSEPKYIFEIPRFEERSRTRSSLAFL
jgi:hypothetical protein